MNKINQKKHSVTILCLPCLLVQRAIAIWSHKDDIFMKQFKMPISLVLVFILVLGILQNTKIYAELKSIDEVLSEIINDNDSRITYSLGWESKKSGKNFNNDIHTFPSATGATVALSFLGSGIDFRTSATGESWGADFHVTITDSGHSDNIVLQESGSMKSGQKTWGAVAYSKRNLLYGNYKIVINFSKGEAGVDAFYVYKPETHQDLTEQQQYLTKWYKAMDPSKGYIDLFSNDISYLTLDQNPIRKEKNVWPAYKDMTISHVWNIESSTAENYYINACMIAPTGAVLRVTVGSNSIIFTVPYSGTNRYKIGQIAVPEGRSTLMLSLESGANGKAVSLNQLELLPASAKDHYDSLVSESRARPNWMKDRPIGAFFQWGEWGRNKDGSYSKWPGAYKGMDWSAFADKLKDSGVDYLIWSVTWCKYYVAAPISAVAAVLPGRTSKHDYLMDILDECKKRDIHVIFYYHAGWDESSWWDPMYKNDLPNGNNARKEKFMDRWLNIIEEMAVRYGTKLDGWMFDYTNSYNPGPFKKITDVARMANPNRMITFNAYNANYYGPTYTSFSDYYMGENFTGDPKQNPFGSIPYKIFDGRYDSGPFEGHQSQFCFITENGGGLGGWGIARDHYAGPISSKFNQDQYNSIVLRAYENKLAMSFCFQMYEDGEVCKDSFDKLRQAVNLAKKRK